MRKMLTKEMENEIYNMSQKEQLIEIKRYAHQHDNIAGNTRIIKMVKSLHQESIVSLFGTLAEEHVFFILEDMVELLEDNLELFQKLYQIPDLNDDLKCKIGLRMIKLDDMTILDSLCRHLIMPYYTFSLVNILKEKGINDKLEFISFRAFFSEDIECDDEEMLLELLKEIQKPEMLLKIAKGNCSLAVKRKAFLQLPTRIKNRNQKLWDDLS